MTGANKDGAHAHDLKPSTSAMDEQKDSDRSIDAGKIRKVKRGYQSLRIQAVRSVCVHFLTHFLDFADACEAHYAKG